MDITIHEAFNDDKQKQFDNKIVTACNILNVKLINYIENIKSTKEVNKKKREEEEKERDCSRNYAHHKYATP